MLAYQLDQFECSPNACIDKIKQQGGKHIQALTNRICMENFDGLETMTTVGNVAASFHPVPEMLKGVIQHLSGVLAPYAAALARTLVD